MVGITNIRIIALLLLILIPVRSYASCPDIPDTYSPIFRQAVIKHWPKEYHGYWELFMAQCYTESRLRPNARSPVGAIGICQIMPATFREQADKVGYKGPMTRVTINIELGAFYMANIMNKFTEERTLECLIEVSWASYSAGFGSIMRAQEKANGARCWENIRNKLSEVTGRHAKETIDYVSRNWKHFRCLKGVGL